MFCHCPAGQVRQVCKHKVALIKGDETMLANPDQASALAEMKSWPQYETLFGRLKGFEAELVSLENERAEITRREKAAKARFGRELVEGISR